MKICHYFHTNEGGGVQNVVAALIERADDAQIEYVICYNREHRTRNARLEDADVTLIHLDRKITGVRDLIYCIRELTTIIEREEIDLVHGHIVHQQIVARCAGKIAGIPVIGTAHSMPGFFSPRLLALERLTRPFEAKTVAVSEGIYHAWRSMDTHEILERRYR